MAINWAKAAQTFQSTPTPPSTGTSGINWAAAAQAFGKDWEPKSEKMTLAEMVGASPAVSALVSASKPEQKGGLLQRIGNTAKTVGGAAIYDVGHIANSLGLGGEALMEKGKQTYEEAQKALDEVGHSRVAQTVMGAGSQYVGSTLRGVQKLSEIAGKGENLGNVADQFTGVGQRHTEEAKEGLGKVGQTAVDIGTGVTQLGFDMLGGPASLALLANRVFGDAVKEAQDEGAEGWKAYAYGAAKGAGEVLIEKLAGNLGKIYGSAYADDITEAIIRKAAKTDAGRSALRTFLGALGEGGEEAASDFLDPVLKAIYDKGEAAKSSYTTGEGLKEMLTQAGYDALIGAGVGLVGDVALGGGENRAKNESLRWQEELAKPEATPTTEAAPAIAPAEATGPAYGRATIPEAEPDGARPKVHETAFSAGDAKLTPDDFKPLLNRSVSDGDFSYMPISNDQSVARATETIAGKGWDQARADWKADVKLGRAGDQMTTVGILLYNNAVNAGDYAAAADILGDLAAVAGNTARGLQAMRMLKSLSPDGQLYMIQRQITNLNEELGVPDGVKLDENLTKAFLEAKTAEERDAILDQMQTDVAKQMPANWFKTVDGKTKVDWKSVGEKWTALRYVNMLGNFKTQARNVAGNTAMGLTVRIKDALAAAMEVFLPKEERTKSLFVSSDLKQLAREDFANIEDVALGEGKFNENPAQGFMKGVNERRKIFTAPVVGNVLEGYRKATNWMMEKGDVVFAKAAYVHALSGFLQARGVSAEQFQQMAESGDPLVDEARSYAIKEAQEATFRDSNALSSFVSKALRGENTPKLFKFFGEGLMPFRKTPANVFMRAWEYSPVGFLSTAFQTYKDAKAGEFDGAKLINELAKNMTGTGLFLLGMALRNAGRLRGGPDDDDKKQDFDQLTGQQNYSFIMDDGSSFTLDWLAPDCIPLFMGVAFEDARQDAGINFKSLEKSLTSLSEPMVQMSMLSGINDALSNIKYSENNLVQLFMNSAVGYLTQGMTNTLVGQFKRFGQDTRKTTWVDKEGNTPSWLQRVLGKNSAKTPGWDYQQQDYIDSWGRTQDTTGKNTLDRIWNTFFNPAYTSQDRTTDVDRELQRLYDAGYTSVLPSAPDTATKVNDQQIGMEAQTEYNIVRGATDYNLLADLFSGSTYQNMTDEQKNAAIGKVSEYASALANANAGSEKDAENWVVNAFNAQRSGNGADYLAMYSLYGANGAEAYSALTAGGVNNANEIMRQVYSLRGDKKATQDNVEMVIRAMGLDDATASSVWNAFADANGWTTTWEKRK